MSEQTGKVQTVMNLKEQIDSARIQSMSGLDIPWLLEQWAERSPDKPCLIWEPFTGQSSSWSYRELRQQAREVATGLNQRGVQAGDFVLIHLDNCPEFIIAWYACAHLGAVAVSTNTRSVARDMSYFAEHVSAVCAITQPSYAQLIKDNCVAIKFLAVTDNNIGESAEVTPELDSISFASLFGDVSQLPPLERDPMRTLSVQFTSGTTSRPKAVLWTHANGLWAGRTSANHMHLQRDDVALVNLPLFHTYAQSFSMLSTHWSGGTLVVQPRFSASRFWDVSLRHRITWYACIPFATKALTAQPVPDHHYRFWGTGANMAEMAEHFGVALISWWGMTETLTQGTVTDIHHPGPHFTMGRAAPEYEIQIRHKDGGLAGPGEKGLLFIRGVRGVSLFKEYYRNDEANEKAFDADGWFDTGDIIRMDEDGWLFFSDRDKDMLKVGAENVAASEIESVIMQTGLVNECAVVAQLHHMLDEVPVAFVIPRPDTDKNTLKQDLMDYCKEQLADFKVVHDVHIVDSLPRSTLEKIAKNELRAKLSPITQ